MKELYIHVKLKMCLEKKMNIKECLTNMSLVLHLVNEALVRATRQNLLQKIEARMPCHFGDMTTLTEPISS